MAILYPSFEKINEFKVPPTAGELNLLKYLSDKFKNDDFSSIFMKTLR